MIILRLLIQKYTNHVKLVNICKCMHLYLWFTHYDGTVCNVSRILCDECTNRQCRHFTGLKSYLLPLCFNWSWRIQAIQWRTVIYYLIEDTCHRSTWHTSQSANTLMAGRNCLKGALRPSQLFLTSKSVACSRVQQALSSKMNISTARLMAWSWGVPTLTYCSVTSIWKRKETDMSP